MLYKIPLFRIRSNNPLAAPALLAVRINRTALDIAAMADHHQRLFLGNQILQFRLVRLFWNNFRTTFVLISFLQFVQIFPNYIQLKIPVGQQCLIISNLFRQLCIFLRQFFNLQPRQTLQLHRQNRIRLRTRQKLVLPAPLVHKCLRKDFLQGLRLRQTKRLAHQVLLGGRSIRRRLNQRNNLINIADRQNQTFQNMGTVAALPKQKPRPAANHRQPVADEQFEHLLDVQRFRTIVHQRDIINCKRRLQRRVSVQFVQYYLAVRIFLQFNDNPHPLAVRLITKVGYFINRAGMNTLRNLRNHVRANHHIRNFRNDNPRPAFRRRLNMRAAAHLQMTAPCHISIQNPLSTADNPPRRKVRPRQFLQNILKPAVRVINHQQQGITNLPYMMRRNIRRHPNRNPAGTVDQKIRKFRRQNNRLHPRLIIVRNKIHRLQLQVLEHIYRRLRQTGLRITHRRRRVGINTPEVPLRVHQQNPHIPVLTHPNQRPVRRLIPMRVIIAARIAHNLGAFAVLRTRTQVQIIHRYQNTPLRRLQTVTHIRQSTGNNHAHRIIQIRRLQLIQNLLFFKLFLRIRWFCLFHNNPFS